MVDIEEKVDFQAWLISKSKKLILKEKMIWKIVFPYNYINITIVFVSLWFIIVNDTENQIGPRFLSLSDKWKTFVRNFAIYATQSSDLNCIVFQHFSIFPSWLLDKRLYISYFKDFNMYFKIESYKYIVGYLYKKFKIINNYI